MPFVLPAELSGAVVTDHIARFTGVFAFLDEGLGFVQFHRLSAAGFDTIANVSHPGLVIGNLQANSLEQSDTRIEAWIYRIVRPFLAQDISMGVLPMLYGMTAEEAKGGALYGPRWFHHRGYPVETRANEEAYDAEIRKRFWEVSEELTGVTFEFRQVAYA